MRENDKIIKKIRINSLCYDFGINSEFINFASPSIKIFNENNSSINLYGNYCPVFSQDFIVSSGLGRDFSLYCVKTIDEMFNFFKKYINIPKEIETEYGNLFLIYKLNDFKPL